MARVVRKATVGSPDPSFTGTAEPNTAIAALAAAIAAAVALVPVPTAFEAALATLVADGASPTQAHVTAVNSAYTTLAALQVTYAAAVAALSTTASAATVSGDVVVVVNLANVTTRKQLTDALLGILNQLRDGTSSFPA